MLAIYQVRRHNYAREKFNLGVSESIIFYGLFYSFLNVSVCLLLY